MRVRFSWKIALIALALLASMVLWWASRRLVPAIADLDAVISSELQSQLGRRVSIESARLVSRGRVVITGLRVAQGGSFASGTLLTVRRVVVDLNLLPLLTGTGSVTGSVRRLTLIAPDLTLVRGKTGEWNIDDLLQRPPVPPNQRFAGVVVIRSGRLTVRDYSSLLTRQPAVNTVEAISGAGDFSAVLAAQIRLSGRGAQARVGRLSLRGAFGLGDPTLTNMTARISGADAGYWLDYFSTAEAWALRGGRLDGIAHLTRTAAGSLRERGNAAITGAVITSPHLDIPLRGVQADVSFVGASIRLTADALLRGSPIRASGTIVTGRRVSLRVTSRRMDPLTLQQAVRAIPDLPDSRWPAPMSLDAAVFGPADAPDVRATISIPRAVVYGVPASGITASGSYSDGTIRISDLRAEVARGTGRLSAAVSLPTGRVTARGTLKNVSLADMPLPAPSRLSGRTDATFSLEWLRGLRSGRIAALVTSGRAGSLAFSRATVTASLTGPRTADAVVRIAEGAIAGVPVESARASLALRGSTVAITQAIIRTASGVIRTSGAVSTTGALNLAVNAEGVSLAALLGPFGYREVTGITDLNGRLTGTLASPVLTGAVSSRDGRIYGVAFDSLRGRLTATPRHVLLTDASIRRQGTEIATTGFVRIPRTAPPEVALRVTARRASLEQLAQIVGVRIDVRGTADVDVDVSGSVPDLEFSGTIGVTDAAVAGVQVDSARVVLRSADGRTVIDRLVASRDGMSVAGSGSIGPQRELSLSFVGENLSLSLLNNALAPYVVFGGPMDLVGTVSGTLSRPTLEGRISSSAPLVNDVPFDRLSGGLRWNGATLSLADALLERADIVYRIGLLSFNTRTEAVRFETSVVNARLDRVLALFRNSPYLQTPEGTDLREALQTVPETAAGDLNASLSLSGTVGQLSGAGSVAGTNITLGSRTISALDVGFIARQSRLLVNRLAVLAPDVDAGMSVRYEAAGPVGFDAELRGTQAAALLDLVRNMPFLSLFELGRQIAATAEVFDEPLAGVINATATVTDIPTGADGSAEFTVTDLTSGDQEIGDISGAVRLSDGTAVIEDFSLTGPMAEASVRGAIGPDRAASLSGSVNGLSLALLGPLIGVPELTGTLDMTFDAAGPIDDPVIAATITATDVSTPQISFDSIVAENLTLDSGRLSAPLITAASNGSRILASASLPFAWEAPFIPRDEPVNVQFSIPSQDLSSLAGFIPLVESASGAIAVNLLVSGTISDPVTSGDLLIENGSVRVDRFNNSFTDLQVAAAFEGSELRFTRFTGASSLGGTFEVTGAVQIPSIRRATADVALNMNALRVSTDDLTGVYSEEITMTATGLLRVAESIHAPLISGQLVVSNAVVVVPSGDLPAPGQPGAVGRNPRFDVTLILASNVRIERGPLEVTVEGPVSVAGSLAEPDISGTVALTEGTLRYPGRTFTLVPGGSATFVWQAPQAPSIAVDLRATTRVIAQSPFTSGITRYTIYLDVSGTIDSLVIDVTSSPPGLTEEETLALVFRQAEIEALLSGVPFRQIVEEQLAQTLLGLAVPGIFEGVTIGPFTVGLEPGVTVPLQAWVSLQFTDRLSLSFLQTLISNERYTIIEINYLIGPQYAAAVQFQDNNEVLYMLQAGWRF